MTAGKTRGGDEPTRRHEDIIGRIKDLIATGAIRPGERFPSERQLEQSLGVSRPVLREAFRVLEAWGWIESRRGSGRYLREPRGTPFAAANPLLNVERATLLDIWEARQALEVRTAALAAERASPGEIAELRGMVAGARLPDDEAARRNVDLELHLAIARATRNFVLRDLVKFQMSLLADIDQRRLLGDDNWRMLCDEHTQIVEAIAARDPTLAAKAMEQHLDDLRRVIFEINRSD